MFISKFEALRKSLLENGNIYKLAQLGTATFEDVSNTNALGFAMFVWQEGNSSNTGTYLRIGTGNYLKDQNKDKAKLLQEQYRKFVVPKSSFSEIPGYPLIYWWTEEFRLVYNKLKKLGDVSTIKQGLISGDNNRYLRSFWEVYLFDISLYKKEGKKFYLFLKGANGRRWFDDCKDVIKYINKGLEFDLNKSSRHQNTESYFKQSIAFSKIGTNNFLGRLQRYNSIFSDAASSIFIENPEETLVSLSSIITAYISISLNPTINNLVATGQNLKWYTTQTIGTPILSSYIFPLNTYIELFVSQTVNGCESERTRAVVYFQNVSTPVGPNNYEFGCEFLKASDLYSISNLYSSPNSYLRWSSSPTGETYFANDQFGISTNSTYYAENTSLDNLCKSSRLPVYITTNPTYYNVPFIENFENPFNCQLGYASPYFGNNSGNQVNNTLTLNNYTLTGINNYVVTKKVNLIANIPVQIFFNAKLLNSNSTIIPLKIKINSNATSQVILGQVNPVSVDNYSQYSFNYTPTVSTQYRVFFEYSCPAQNIGFVIDNFGITNNLDINDFENLNSLIQYPNPTEGYFFIETTVMQINKIEVFDLQGRLLKTIKENKDKYQIDISDFASATYLVKLSTEKGSQTVKIVKK